MSKYGIVSFFIVMVSSFLYAADAPVLIETEHFADYGGWVHDSQFMDQMGSPFLLAHGLGVPVNDATTTLKTKPGTYRVWVRTRDWVATWKAPGAPGRFQLIIDGKPLETTFGTEGADWHWQDGGTVSITKEETPIALHDLTGFEGRCDAIIFSADLDFLPPNDDANELAAFRRKALGLPETPEFKGKYDLVVVGGGIAGTCAAVSAARNGIKVALIQDRPVLGGNNSSEVRVWLQGARNLAPYQNVGNVVAELEQKQAAHYGPTNVAEIYEDEKKLAIVRAEENISLFLEHRVNDVIKDGNRIVGVIAQATRTGHDYRFDGATFSDCTGDGCLGFLAGADHEVTLDGHMGPCNLWNVKETGEEASFPHCSWALNLSDKPFPGRENILEQYTQLGGWFWESGFYHDPIGKSEYIRDWNFRAAYGAWDAVKNVDKTLPTYKLNWMAHVAGKRESRRLMGDVVLSKNDLLNSTQYDDAAVPTGWKIDLHLPAPEYQKGFEGDEFIAVAHYTDYKTPYWIPYRCFYSRNIENLFMAGRDISVTHEALGATRVMRTGGCMGEIVGMAAAICSKYQTTPRGVYKEHLAELIEMMKAGVTPSPEFGIPMVNFLKPTKNNVAGNAKIQVSEESNADNIGRINDGQLDCNDNESRWLSHSAKSHEIVFQWEKPVDFNTMRIVSGYTQNGSTVGAIADFKLQQRQNETWIDVPKSAIMGNNVCDRVCQFPEVTAATVRLIISATPNDIARIWEVEFYQTAANAAQ